MAKRIIITKQEAEQIKAKRKEIKDKKVDKRLYAVQLRGEGLDNNQIAEKLDTCDRVVSRWVSSYKNKGIESLLGGKYGGNNRNASDEELSVFLKQYEKAAENGQIIEISEIAATYDKMIGKIHKSHSTVYYLLHKFGWRKVMPRSKHPKKASEEAIDASKKLTCQSKN